MAVDSPALFSFGIEHCVKMIGEMLGDDIKSKRGRRLRSVGGPVTGGGGSGGYVRRGHV
jgi:hypothetical protein